MEIGILVLILLVLAILLSATSQPGTRSSEEYEEEIRTLKEIIADDVQKEREMQTGSIGEVLVVVLLVGALAAILILIWATASVAAPIW